LPSERAAACACVVCLAAAGGWLTRACRAVLMLRSQLRQCCTYGRQFPKGTDAERRRMLHTLCRRVVCVLVDSPPSYIAPPTALMVRFVAAQDAQGVARVVPDAAARLPGRGAYTLACPHVLAQAVATSAPPPPSLRHNAVAHACAACVR
jgi:hypothetical protein